MAETDEVVETTSTLEIVEYEQGRRVQVRAESSVLHAHRYGFITKVVTINNVRTLLVQFEDHRAGVSALDWFMDGEVVDADPDGGDAGAELFS